MVLIRKLLGLLYIVLGREVREALCCHIIYEAWNPSSQPQIHAGVTFIYSITNMRAGKQRIVQEDSLAGRPVGRVSLSPCAQQVRARKPSQAQS